MVNQKKKHSRLCMSDTINKTSFRNAHIVSTSLTPEQGLQNTSSKLGCRVYVPKKCATILSDQTDLCFLRMYSHIIVFLIRSQLIAFDEFELTYN